MPRDTLTFPHSDSSDDDDLPFLPSFCNITIKKPRKKTFDELFKENADLIESQERLQGDLEQIASIQNTLNDDEKSGDEDNEFYEKNKLLEKSVLDEKNESDTFEDPSVRLFGELNNLQFITWDDLTLPKCGFDPSLSFSELEKLLIALNENELQEEIKNCETFSPKNLKQLNPFVQYVFKTMSLHSDPAYVNACKKFIKKIISDWHYIKNISISYADVFMVLFNYGIDVKKDIFNMLPGSKEIPRTKIIKEIPKNWMFNLKAALSSIGDLMKHFKMEEEDLFNIFIYLLWMSMDVYLNVNMALKLCTEIILLKFSTENWPVWRLKIVQFVISTTALKSNQWNLVLSMLKCIYHESSRGAELRNYLSYVVLKKLKDSTSDSNVVSKYFVPEYSESLFSVKNLQPILESICGMKKSLQLVAIKFINLFTMSLKLSSKEEHSKLLIALKRCENSISNHASIQQSKLCIIHSRISTLTPNERGKKMLDALEKQEETSDDDEDKSETSHSPMDKQSFSEEPRASPSDCASNDRSQKQNYSLQSIITDQDGSQDLTEDLQSKENCATINATIASKSPLDKPLVNKQLKENSVFGMPKEVLEDGDCNTLKSTVTQPIELNKENSEDKCPKENHPKVNDVPHLCAVNEQQLMHHEQTKNNVQDSSSDVLPSGSKVALELIVSSAAQNPETNSNVRLETNSERFYSESDGETTETSSEREDLHSDEKKEFNSEREKYFTPSKSFLIDHYYWDIRLNASKNLNSCFDKVALSSDESKSKSGLSTNQSEGKNVLEMRPDEMAKNSAAFVETVPSLNSQETIKKDAQYSVNNHPLDKNKSHAPDSIIINRSNTSPERHFNVLPTGVVSVQNKFLGYQNSSAVQTSNISEAPNIIKVDSNVAEHIGKNPDAIPSTPVNVHLHYKTELKPIDETTHVNVSSSANSLHAPDVKKSADAYSQACSIVNPDVLTSAYKSEETSSPENHKLAESIANMEKSGSPYTEASRQSQMEVQNDSVQSETLQNLISSQCLIPESSRNDRNFTLNLEDINKVKPSELLRYNEADNPEAALIDSVVEEVISKIYSSESKTLQNLASLPDLISYAVSENSMDSVNNRDAISNMEHREKASESIKSNEEALIDSVVEKVIFKIDSSENKALQKLTSLSNLISSVVSENPKDSMNNRNVISNIEHCDKVKPSELIRSNEAAFIDSEKEQNFSGINSDESKTLQNLTSSPNLISCAFSQNSSDSINNRNVISNVEHYNKVSTSELVRSKELDNTEAAFIDFAIEEMITKIQNNSAQNETLFNPLQNLISCPVSENSRELTHCRNNSNTIDKFENKPKTNAENILNFPGVFVLPLSRTDTSESSNNDANIVPNLLNVENDQNVIDLQSKNISISTTSVQLFMHPSTKSDAVNESDPTQNVIGELTIPEVKRTDGSTKASSDNSTTTEKLTSSPVIMRGNDGSTKVSSDDSTTTEKLTSSPVIMRGIDLDPLYSDVNSNPLDILVNNTQKSKEDGHFIPRSVHIKTTKTMHSSDLRLGQNSEKELTSNFQNLVQNSSMQKNENFNTSEINNSANNTNDFSLKTKLDIKRKEIIIPSFKISERNQTLKDKAELDMFNNDSEIDETGCGISSQPNIVHLRPVENIKGFDNRKRNSIDNKKLEVFRTPSQNIIGKNQKLSVNNNVKHTNKPVTGDGSTNDDDEPFVEHQNINFPSSQLSQAGASSKTQPDFVEFPPKKFPSTSCSSPKRKHTHSISHLTSKRPRIAGKLHLGNLRWEVNFPASLPPVENLNRQNKAKIGPVVNNSSSVYYTEICNSQLANEIPGTRESSEVITDHSSNIEPIKSQENSEIINTKDLSDSNSSNSSDSDSSSSSETSGSYKSISSSKNNSSSGASSSDSKNSKSKPKVPNVNKPKNQDKRNNLLKDLQPLQSTVDEFAESIYSDSEDEILIIEEFGNIQTNAKNKSNTSLPSLAVDKRQKLASLNSSSQMPNQNSVKTPTKPKQPSHTKYFNMPKNKPVSLFNFLEDECTDNLRIPKESSKPEPRITKKSINCKLRSPAKSSNPEQRKQKNLVSNSCTSSAKKPKLTQTLFTPVPHVDTSNPIPSPKASTSGNQDDDDVQCLDSADKDCRIITQNVPREVITLD